MNPVTALIAEDEAPQRRALQQQLRAAWPAWLGAMYDTTDHLEQRGGWRAAFQRLNARPFLRELQRLQPRLIVNTHFLAAELIAEQRRAGRLTCPQATVLTVLERAGTEEVPEHVSRFLERSAILLQGAGAAASTRVRRGPPLREIRAELAEGKHDLLVLGAPFPSVGSRTVLGGLVAEVLEEPPPCPVLVVRARREL